MTSGTALNAKRVLLLLGDRQALPADFCLGWTQDDWSEIRRMLQQHRLMPMLHWRLEHEHANVQVPAELKGELRSLFQKSCLRALAMQADLMCATKLLSEAGIPVLVLKGPYLARFSYPHIALRPMRDLDILVHEADVLRAYEVLLAGGATRVARAFGDPSAFLAEGKHLPPIRSPSRRCMIEVHARMMHADDLGPGGHVPATEHELWSRSVVLPTGQGEELRYLSPTDLLLHLIVHAAYSHRFNNGALIITDVAYLIRTQSIDWSMFWQLARQGGWLRCAVLVLSMTHRWMLMDLPEMPDVRAGEGDVEAIALAASVLCLQEVATRVDDQLVQAVLDAPGLVGRGAVLWRKAFPPRNAIAARYPVRADSPWIYLWYLARWGHVARRSVGALSHLRARSARLRVRGDEQRHGERALEQWLQRKVV